MLNAEQISAYIADVENFLNENNASADLLAKFTALVEVHAPSNFSHDNGHDKDCRCEECVGNGN